MQSPEFFRHRSGAQAIEKVDFVPSSLENAVSSLNF